MHHNLQLLSKRGKPREKEFKNTKERNILKTLKIMQVN